MSRTVDPTEIRDTTDRLAHQLEHLDLGSCVPATLAELVTLGERIERLGHGLEDPRPPASPRIRGVAGRRRSHGGGLAGPPDRHVQGRCGAAGRDRPAARSPPRGRRGRHAGRAVRGQAEAIAGAAAADPGAQRRLLAKAKDGSLRELQDECRRTRVNAESDPEAAHRRAHAKRSCRIWTDADGVTGHLHLSGPVAEVARVDNAIRHRADKLFRQARAEGRREPSEAYAYDAATQLMTAPVTASASPLGADAKIIVRIDHTALRRGHAVEGETCEIAGIGPVPVATVREWMGDAFLAAVLTKGDDVQRVVHLGRKFKATQRTALQWQNPVCARKGCSNRLGLEYDHFEDWADHPHHPRRSRQAVLPPLPPAQIPRLASLPTR